MINIKSAIFILIFSPLLVWSEIFVPDSNPSLKKRVDYMKEMVQQQSDLDAFSKDRYGDYGPIAMDTLEEMCKEYLPLIAFPGLILQLENFEKFVRDKKLECGDPWKAAQLFSDSLGTTTVYRAINLSDDDFANIKKEGIQSNAVRWFVNLKPYSKFSFAMELMRRAREDKVRLKPNLSDRVMSLSSDPEISRTVSFAYASYKDIGKKNMYLFKIEIPKLENLYISPANSELCEYPARTNEEFHPDLVGNPSVMRPILCKSSFFPEKIETFAEFVIEPDEIKEYEKVAITAADITKQRDEITKISIKNDCTNLDALKSIMSTISFYATKARCWLKS